MNKQRWVDWTALALILLLAAFYVLTLKDVPFHPDESTQLYMSKDFSTLFSTPLELSWAGNPLLDNEERIRAIDAPLAKYLIGASQKIFSTPPLAADWDWSLSWEENQSAGALPSGEQLLAARFAITVFLPLGLWIYYLALKKIIPGIPSLLAMVLLGLNPLFLLHGRRAMSEGILIFGVVLLLWTITRDKRNPWLIGLALSICINTKHSALSLIPAAFLALILLPDRAYDLKNTAGNILKTTLVVFLTFFLLNPFYWKQPYAALKTGAKARFTLASDQAEDYLPQSGRLKTTLPALILNTYFTSPQTEEVGNYLQETQDTRNRYLENPFHNWSRNILGGSILLTLTLAGIGRVLWTYSSESPVNRNNYLLLAIGTLGVCAFTIFLLPWQRYVIPVLPFTYIWVGAGLAPILRNVAKS